MMKTLKKFLPLIMAGVVLAAMVPAVSAYEAHLIDIKVHVEQPPRATRTLGFWKTHLDYTGHVFYDYLNGNINLGWRDVYTISDLMGVFWADTAKDWDDTPRSELCKARVKAAQQALGAVLNSALPEPAPMPASLAYIQSTLSGTDIDAIDALHTALDVYNNSGDFLPIEDSYPIGNATPGLAQAIACIPFADCP